MNVDQFKESTIPFLQDLCTDKSIGWVTEEHLPRLNANSRQLLKRLDGPRSSRFEIAWSSFQKTLEIAPLKGNDRRAINKRIGESLAYALIALNRESS